MSKLIRFNQINYQLYYYYFNIPLQFILMKLPSKDFFGYKTQGINYQLFRPRYPKSLLNNCLLNLKNKQNYLDVATGTGQVLFQLGTHFSGFVAGTDISQNMINVSKEKAQKIKIQHNKDIQVLKMNCLESPEKHKFDLITVGQALHWFNVQNYLKHTSNILNQGGKFVALAYYMNRIDTVNRDVDINQYYDKFYGKVKAFFDFDRDELCVQEYESQKYPFSKYFKTVKKQIQFETSELKTQNFLNYMKTYSGYNVYIQKNEDNPIIQFTESLKQYETILMTIKYFGIFCQQKI